MPFHSFKSLDQCFLLTCSIVTWYQRLVLKNSEPKNSNFNSRLLLASATFKSVSRISKSYHLFIGFLILFWCHHLYQRSSDSDLRSRHICFSRTTKKCSVRPDPMWAPPSAIDITKGIQSRSLDFSYYYKHFLEIFLGEKISILLYLRFGTFTKSVSVISFISRSKG